MTSASDGESTQKQAPQRLYDENFGPGNVPVTADGFQADGVALSGVVNAEDAPSVFRPATPHDDPAATLSVDEAARRGGVVNVGGDNTFVGEHTFGPATDVVFEDPAAPATPSGDDFSPLGGTSPLEPGPTGMEEPPPLPEPGF